MVKTMRKRNPWGGSIGKSAVLSVARKVQAQDGVSWARALRKALAWAKRKAGGDAAPLDPYASARSRGIYSPRDRSPDAQRHFAEHRRRFPGRGYGPQTEGR